MPLVTYEHAPFRFTVRKLRDGSPYIALVPKGKGLTSLGDAYLTLEFRAGISMEQARAIAKQLNENIEKLRLTRIQP